MSLGPFRQAVLTLVWAVITYQNGQMRRPAMGYNPWNAFHDAINETVILDTANLMVDLGLVAAGYQYLVLDGLKLGIYSDAGHLTCLRYPASLAFEPADAESFAAWGVDFLKYDNCYSADPAKVSVRTRYEAMRDALNATGRPIAFSMCEWGVSSPWEYGSEVANSWRTNADISLGIEADWRGVVDNLDATVGLSRFAGPGGWNDCDMLEVGPPGGQRLTLTEQQAHFALWAIVKSPLFIGADLRLLMAEHLAILKAKEVIGLNQDPLGVAGDLVWKQGPKEVWAVPLQGGDRGVVLFNRHLNSDHFFQWANLSVQWSYIGLPSECQVVVRDLYRRKDLGRFSHSFSASVRNHGVLALRLKPTREDCKDDGWRPWTTGVMTHTLGDPEPEAEADRICEHRSYWHLPLSDLPVSRGLNFSGQLYLIGFLAGLSVGILAVLAYMRGSAA